MRRSFFRGVGVVVALASAAACGAFESTDKPSTAADAGSSSSSSSGGAVDAAAPDAAGDGGAEAAVDGAPACDAKVECLPGAPICAPYPTLWQPAVGGNLPSARGPGGFHFSASGAAYGYVYRQLPRSQDATIQLDLDTSSTGRLSLAQLVSADGGSISVEAADTTYVTCVVGGSGAGRQCSAPTTRPPGPQNHRLRWTVIVTPTKLTSSLQVDCGPSTSAITNVATAFSIDTGELDVKVGIIDLLGGPAANVEVRELRLSRL